MKILLADDEPDVLEFLSFNLAIAGYEVILANNGKEAIELALKSKPYLLVLDVMMPIHDGYVVCQELRKYPEFDTSIIIFLTAKTEDEAQIQAFNLGANDFIQKPVKLNVFLSRIHAIHNQWLKKSEQKILKLKNLELDLEKYSAKLDGIELVLARKEFKLLYLLASTPGKVFDRNQILESIWGDEVIVGERTVDVHVRKLREKVGDSFIKTLKGVGYKFEL